MLHRSVVVKQSLRDSGFIKMYRKIMQDNIPFVFLIDDVEFTISTNRVL